MKEKMYMKPLFESSPSFGPNYHGKKISEITNAPVSHFESELLKPLTPFTSFSLCDFQVLPDDGLPASFCQYCLVQLIDTTKIKSTLIESHKKQLNLREALHRMYYEGKKR